MNFRYWETLDTTQETPNQSDEDLTKAAVTGAFQNVIAKNTPAAVERLRVEQLDE